MEQQQKALGTARLIATLLYVVPLVVFPWAGRLLRMETALDPKVIGVLAPALLFVGATDYAVSLFLEGRMLGQARGAADPGRQAFVTAVLVAAFGTSLAIYGLVVTMLGAPTWGGLLYVLCAVHGLHLMVRWPSYAAAAEQTDSSV